jgi:hypothetical protein
MTLPSKFPFLPLNKISHLAKMEIRMEGKREGFLFVLILAINVDKLITYHDFEFQERI